MEILVPTRVELNLLNYKSKSVFILIAIRMKISWTYLQKDLAQQVPL